MGGMPAPIPGQADLPLIPSAVEAIDKELSINPEEGASAEVSSDMDVDCDHEVPPTI